jgi:polysaccharide deacetylase 2 family uncharacterized protein YibQ
LPAAILLLLGVFAGLALWLLVKEEQTLAERAALVPTVTVPVTVAPGATSAPPAATVGGETEPKPAPTPAPAPIPAPVPAVEAPAKPAEPPPPPVPEGPITLAPAPAAGLTQDSRNGPLPIVGDDGRQPWQVYARPFRPKEKQGRIAIVITRLGLSGGVTSLALQRLPAEVTLAFSPLSERIETWLETARKQGHEVILNIGMEPLNYPHDDPGPNTLFTFLDAAHNTDRLEWALGRATGYVGITSTSGSRFTAEAHAIRPVLEALKKRGLLFLDARAAPSSVAPALGGEIGLARVTVDRVLDLDPARTAIDEKLSQLEELASKNGQSVGIAEPYLTTLERIARWAPLLADKNLVLAPLSALVTTEKTPPAKPVEAKHSP